MGNKGCYVINAYLINTTDIEQTQTGECNNTVFHIFMGGINPSEYFIKQIGFLYNHKEGGF